MLRTKQRPELGLTTSRLVLRPVVEPDLDDIVAEIDDFEVARWLARVPHPYSRADAEAFCSSLARNVGRDLALTIVHDGQVIGGLGLSGVNGEREFGYWLGRAHWGHGFATEAGLAFLAHCFDTFSLDIVRSGVFVGNDASLRVQEKLGFVGTGRRNVYCLARGGDLEHIDTILTRERFALANAPLA